MTKVVAGLALAGLGIAGYLTYVHYAGVHPVCVASGGCETVQSSSYAKLAGIPVPVPPPRSKMEMYSSRDCKRQSL